MSSQEIELANAVHWDHAADDKVYLEAVRITVEAFPFANRQVFVRFVEGPELDLSIWDMDRLVAAYQAARSSAQLPTRALEKPDPCDFSVPVYCKKPKSA